MKEHFSSIRRDSIGIRRLRRKGCWTILEREEELDIRMAKGKKSD